MSDLLFSAMLFAVAIPAIVFHEVSHGYMAFLLGDRTAKDAGRLSLDPLKHVDLFGTILLPAMLALIGSPAVFGYAKPVPINPRFFRNFRFGLMWTGLAGPLSNLLMATVSGLIVRVLPFEPGLNLGFSGVVVTMLTLFCVVNLVLMFFNLIPIPPFDGSRIIPVFLSDAGLRTYAQIERFGFVIILVLLFFGRRLVELYFAYTVFPMAALLAGPQWSNVLLR